MLGRQSRLEADLSKVGSARSRGLQTCSVDIDSESWDYYLRAPSRAGWTFPVGQSRVREALELAGARVRYLNFGGGYDGGPFGLIPKPRPRSVLRAWWSTDSNPYRRRTDSGDRMAGGWAGLDLHAVPSSRAAAARGLLENDLLDQAAAWLAAVEERGNAWRASDHELEFFIEGEVVNRTET